MGQTQSQELDINWDKQIFNYFEKASTTALLVLIIDSLKTYLMMGGREINNYKTISDSR